MKKKIKIVALSSLCLFTLGAMVTSTVAWFKYGSNVNFGSGETVYLHGGTEAFFFGKGSGTDDSPYEISSRNQLYNLAWLQYIGYFDGSSDKQPLQPYFKVTADIDMTGITLPPIGTEQHPFIGNFDGGGHTISNITISNDDPITTSTHTTTDFGTMKPDNATLEGTVPPEVVGFFGVVGKLPSQSLSYDSSIVGMTNFTLHGVSVTSKTDHTLMGLAAGYVDGLMSGVTIGGTASLKANGETTTAALDSITDKVSNYGLVGYTTDTAYGGTYSQDYSEFYDSDDDSGAGDEWGGSIAVEEIFNRLTYIKSNYTVRNNSFVTEVRETVDRNDNRVGNLENVNTSSEPVFEYNEDNHNGAYNNKLGAFQFGTTRTDIHYLSGGHFTRKYHQYLHDGYQITDGTNYLMYNGSTIGNTTNGSDTSVITTWHFVQKTGNQYYIRINYNSTSDNRYLYNDNGTLSLGTGTSTADNATWTVITYDDGIQIVNNTHQIYFSNQWILSPLLDVTAYLMRSGSNYISFSGTSEGTLNNVTSKYSAAHFYIESGTNYIYFYNNNYGSTKLYLAIYYKYSSTLGIVHSVTHELRAINATGQSNYNYLVFSNNTLSTVVGIASSNFLSSPSITQTTEYVGYSGGWTYVTSGGVVPTLETLYYSPYRLGDTVSQPIVQREGPDKYTDSSAENNYMDYSGQDVTYFPLNTKTDYTPADNNTGYIIGGSSYTSSNTNYGSGTVRISNFYKLSTNITNYSSSTHKLTNVRTYNASGPTTINDSSNTYQRYAESKSKVENILKKHESEDQVYGLHFMQNLIDKNYLVTARYAQINTTAYSNYQLPASSIDFNLKERGFVNFFAGTYGNLSGEDTTLIDSFFSIHQIRRDSNNNIVSIDEIDQILSDGNPDHAYIYKLSNGKYTIPYSYNMYNQKIKYIIDTKTPLSTQYPDEEFTQVSSCPGTYSVVFDTSWIKVHSDYAQHVMYYFEIPINCGEFCLGSVSGSHFGAYLVYLDIGAFARDNDIVHAYHITTHGGSLPFPSGVDFAVAGADGVTGGDSICIYLDSGINGSVTFVVTESNIAITDASSLSTYSYKGTKFSETPATGKFTVSGNSPGDLDEPPPGGERLMHIDVDATDGSKWYIDILDELDANGNVLSTSYPLIKRDGEDMEVEDIPFSVVDALDTRIRPLARIATLTRNSGKTIFTSTATYDEATRKIVNIIISQDELENITLKASNIVSGYTISINGTGVSNGTVYP